MKTTTTRIFRTIAAMAIASGLWGCAAESPFDTEDYGTVRLHTVVSNITTRALSNDETAALEEKCVVYVSDCDSKQLILKKVGLANILPTLRLTSGDYVAEAWSGDSVPASFDKRFFRGYQPFTVTPDAEKSVALECGIMNVIVSIDINGINELTETKAIMKDDYAITIKSCNASLTFNKDNLDKKGYFMLPQDNFKVKINPETADATVSTLNYTITGTRADGNRFTVNGEIKNVKPAYQYILKLNYDGQGSTEDQGGGSITIETQETAVTDAPQVSVSAPAITGIGFDVTTTLNYSDLSEETTVQICGHGGLKNIHVYSDCAELGLPSATTDITGSTQLPEGMDFFAQQKNSSSEGSTENSSEVYTAYIIFKKALLENLPTGETHITISATDNYGLDTTRTLTINR